MSFEVERTFRLGDVFRKSFGVFGRHFATFFVLTVIANLPSFILDWVSASAAPSTLGSAVSLLVGIVCTTIANGTMTYSVVQDLRGGSVLIGEAIGIAARRFVPMFAVGLVVDILTSLATMLLLVPGLVVACMYFVAEPVCIAERQGVGTSLLRSRFLTKGHRWQVFLITVLGLIVGGVVAGLAYTMGPIELEIGIDAVQTLFGSFYAVLVAVFHYELRVAKEGIDLTKIASVFD